MCSLLSPFAPLVLDGLTSLPLCSKKTDPNGDYIRKWLPQFRRYPTKYIYEPWTAPLEVQRRCGVVIGVDYPHPIVEHAVISKSNMQRMKHAYDAHNSANANAGA